MKVKSIFVCSACEYHAAKWMGRCPSCGAWNTLEEQVVSDEKRTVKGGVSLPYAGKSAPAVRLKDLEMPQYMRFDTGYAEVDRVLGGGLVSGSVVLLSGEPGIGKSTLLMQICGKLAALDRKILYVSGEESPGQLKMRARRLGVEGGELYVQTETNLERIFEEIDAISPHVVVADSVQTIYSEASASAPGSVTQVKEAAARLISLAKNQGVSVILVGHVNKEGSIAGPKVLEHMVDAVLHFEGERENTYRIIRAIKNRFGSTNEIGVFEMTGEGLAEVPNPSEALLAGRPKNVSGNCAVCVMEGTRPIVAEIQALVTNSVLASPRRTSNGFDYNRLNLLLAVLEKRIGLRFSSCDAYMNVIGGLRLDDPAADLPAALALISCIKDKPLPDDLIAVGEIGLAGECRAIAAAEQRVREAERLGFSRILLPARNVGNGKLDPSRFTIKIEPVKSLYDALATALN
ncbi:MAG: DNA repair protein RadA [Ruminococcaceae bacterium]|nr:DNA repair protein RadA [Oscillospiraceae bacterium]